MGLQNAQDISESWLKCIHDSVQPTVVAEVVILYIQTCNINNIISNKIKQRPSNFAQFLIENIKESIYSARINEQYDIAAILVGVAKNKSKDTSYGTHKTSEETQKGSNSCKQATDGKNGLKFNSLLEYFRDEKKIKEWWEYIEEIEMLLQDDVNIAIALWQHGIFPVIPQ
ncbi:hypothetical protein RFI_07619, partial [Reticulomyxa filosa]